MTYLELTTFFLHTHFSPAGLLRSESQHTRNWVTNVFLAIILPWVGSLFILFLIGLHSITFPYGLFTCDLVDLPRLCCHPVYSLVSLRAGTGLTPNNPRKPSLGWARLYLIQLQTVPSFQSSMRKYIIFRQAQQQLRVCRKGTIIVRKTVSCVFSRKRQEKRWNSRGNQNNK